MVRRRPTVLRRPISKSISWRVIRRPTTFLAGSRILKLYLAGERSTTESAQVLHLSGLANDQMRLKVKQPRDRPLKQILVIDDFTFEIREEWHS